MRELGLSGNTSVWDWVQYGAWRALIPIGIGSIVWAIILSMVGLQCKVPGILERLREKNQRVY